MSNTLLTIDMITRKMLFVLMNNLGFVSNVNRQYDDSFAKEGAKIGSTLRIRKPSRYIVTNGAALQVQDDVEQYTTLTCSSQKHVGVNFTTAEMTLSLDDFTKRIIEPAMMQLAASIDADVANVYKYFGNSVGTPGTTPGTAAVLLAGNQKLSEFATPLRPRIGIVNPAANGALVGGMAGYFNAQDTIAKQFKSGLMGTNVLGLDEICMSQSVAQFTTGTRVAATTSAAVSAQGATTIALTISGGTATDTIKAGDVFTVGSCFAVNPQTRQTTGSLFQFVALSDQTASGSAVTVTVAPIYSADAVAISDQAQATVDSLPGNAKTVTFLGAANTAYPQNMIIHPDSIAFATADLLLPQGVDMASRAVHDGISMRLVRQYDINNDRMPCRVDVLYGYAAIRTEMGCRLWG